MRKLGAVVVLLLVAAAAPSRAEELKACGDIKDAQARMSCMQDHITHLEQTILNLTGQIAALQADLDKKLSADAVYKLRSVTQGKCLGVTADGADTVNCDRPDSWKLMLGGQTPPKPADKPGAKPAANANAGSGSAAPATADNAKPNKNKKKKKAAAGADAKPTAPAGADAASSSAVKPSTPPN